MTRNQLLFLISLLSAVGLLAACQATPGPVAQGGPPTATLAPIVNQTPRSTATPVPTRTPIPTETPVPDTPTPTFTPSRTPTPTEPPPVTGIVNSLQRVNVRTGPGITYQDFAALDPGTGVEIIGQSSDGRWLNVMLEDGDEGWMAASLLRLQPTPTPFPTVTPTVDENALAQATPLPTSIIGGQAITPTLPSSVALGVTATLAFSGEELVFEPTEALRDLFASDEETEEATDEATGEAEAEASATRGETDLDSTPIVFTNTPSPTATATSPLVVDESVLPVIDIEAINATATALAEAGAAVPVSPTPSSTPTVTRTPTPRSTSGSSVGNGDILTPEDRIIDLETGTAPAVVADATVLSSITPNATVTPTSEEIVIGEVEVTATTDGSATPIPTARVSSGDTDAPENAEAVIRNGVDVLAYCDDESFDAAPPDNIKAGSTVDVYWVWFASTEQQINDHLNAAVYDIRVDDNPLQRLRQYRQPIEQIGSDYAVYWYAPIGPLLPGEHNVTYSVTWSNTIFDGYQFFGPGTNTVEETGTCTFTVYE